MDNRGHGKSRKVYDPKLYLAHEMADDAARLLDHLGLARVPVIGFSMGARITAFLMLRHPERVRCAVWGGMGDQPADRHGRFRGDHRGADRR